MTTAASVATRAEGEALGHFVTPVSEDTWGPWRPLDPQQRVQAQQRAEQSQQLTAEEQPNLPALILLLPLPRLTPPFVLHVPNQQIPRWADSAHENKRSLFLTLAFCLFHKPSCLTDGSGAYQGWWKWKGEIVSSGSKEMFSLALLPPLGTDSNHQPQKPHLLYWPRKDLNFLNSN